MEFFDKLGKTASQTYKYTAEKTSKLAKEAKLKMSMNDKKSKIENIYNQIGKKFYAHHIAHDEIDIDIEAVLNDYCVQIDDLCDQIEDEKNQLLTLKDQKQCPECLCEIESDCKFCPNCGAKQNEVSSNVEDVKVADEIVNEEDK